MNLIEKGLAAAERRHERRVRRSVASQLEVGEDVIAWFHAMAPGETARKAAAARAAVGGVLLQRGVVLHRAGTSIRIDDTTPRLREWVVLTNHNRILEVKTSRTGGRPTDVIGQVPATTFKALQLLDDGYRQGPHYVHFGVLVTGSNRALVFEVPPYSRRPLIDFCEKLALAHRALVGS